MTDALRPLCFVVMPFGAKPDGHGGSVDFDAVYAELIGPAIADAGLQPLRADQELVGGLIHKPMFERLVLSDYAVADVTTANANVFYEIGVRHAVRPYSTVLIGADVKATPFDLAPDRVLPYRLDPAGRPAAAAEDREVITKALNAARERATDSPVFQLLDDLPAPQIDRLKTDVFREQAAYSATAKTRLADARGAGVDALRAFEAGLGPLIDVEAGVLVDLLLSYRAVGASREMVRLVEAMPAPVAQTALVQEQYAFALNRDGQGERAESVLNALIEQRGASSETYGLLGRVYKDRWAAERDGSAFVARGLLKRAIDAYRSGFEADWRDAYPGVNAVTLMEILEPGGAEQQRLIPVVRYAVARRIASGNPDYWDQATLLELAVLARDEDAATEATGDALALVREPWEAGTTANNLALIRDARAANGETVEWADAIEQELLKASKG
jgi:hypothetical protein